MEIQNDRTLQELKQAFSAQFPSLKIEFYATPHDPGHGSAAREQLDERLRVGEVRNGGASGSIELNPEMSAADFERLLSEQYQLHAQLFRRSGNIWLQTTSTDSWTLAEQNRKGGASAEHYDEKYKA